MRSTIGIRNALALASALAACGVNDAPDAPTATIEGADGGRDIDRAPPVGGSTSTRARGPDGGQGDGGQGAAALIAPGCVVVAPADTRNFANVFEEGTRVPFPVSAAFARIAADAGGGRTLLIGLTDGACERGVGQQLTFEVDVSAVGRDVRTGENQLARDGALRVRFADFSDPGVPEIFGTCSDASGTVAFGQLATSEGALSRATFPGIRLGPCVDGSTRAPVTIDGAFDVSLPGRPLTR